MKNKITLIAFLVFSLPFFAQVGIGTQTPNGAAVLDLTSPTKGLLLPRVALTGTANAAPLSAHVAGMNVYNTAAVADVTPGNYFNDGTKWVRVFDGEVGDFKQSAQRRPHGNWLLCDGSAVSSADYPALYAVIGNSFGGNSTTFNLPDYRGKVMGTIGQGTGLTNRVMGNSTGAENHTLTAAESGLPIHTHTATTTVNIKTNTRGYSDYWNTRLDSYDPNTDNQGGWAIGTTIIAPTLAKDATSPLNLMQPTLFGSNVFIHY